MIFGSLMLVHLVFLIIDLSSTPRVCLFQACFFTDFPAIQDNGVSLILSLEEKSLRLGRKSLSLEKNTGVYGENPPV